MIFVSAITTQPNTAKSAPLVTQIPIVAGTINRLLIFFPPGVNALAHIKLLYGLAQIFPSNEQGDFAGGDVLIDWNEDVEIPSDPTVLTAVTWNDDNTYAHTITVHIVLTPASPSRNISDVLALVQQAQGGG